jgi:hypothetical protein
MTKSKLEIIEETVEFYKNNPRSINNDEGWDKCVYLNDDGHKCAFSRCCTDEGVTWLHEEIDIGRDGGSVIQHFLEHLKPEYQGHDIEFWKDIQKVHDKKLHWDGQILTELGIEFVNILKKEYGQHIEN